MEALRMQDDPWRRLPWQAPLAMLLTFLSLMGFLRLLEQTPDPRSAPGLVDVRVVEVPATGRAASAPSALPDPPPRRRRRAPRGARPSRRRRRRRQPRAVSQDPPLWARPTVVGWARGRSIGPSPRSSSFPRRFGTGPSRWSRWRASESAPTGARVSNWLSPRAIRT